MSKHENIENLDVSIAEVKRDNIHFMKNFDRLDSVLRDLAHNIEEAKECSKNDVSELKKEMQTFEHNIKADIRSSRTELKAEIMFIRKLLWRIITPLLLVIAGCLIKYIFFK
ncbi:hypothetical protein [Candidiatus Paracoxiella cheracis]|uniref:hypothetical protein n=1 Tax=Candidiatus Paracoxiella cheracis TaxID=3405120 RepID=UPI003BF55900